MLLWAFNFHFHGKSALPYWTQIIISDLDVHTSHIYRTRVEYGVRVNAISPSGLGGCACVFTDGAAGSADIILSELDVEIAFRLSLSGTKFKFLLCFNRYSDNHTFKKNSPYMLIFSLQCEYQ